MNALKVDYEGVHMSRLESICISWLKQWQPANVRKTLENWNFHMLPFAVVGGTEMSNNRDNHSLRRLWLGTPKVAQHTQTPNDFSLLRCAMDIALAWIVLSTLALSLSLKIKHKALEFPCF